MKIVLTGGGTGGHFYPLIAIAENLRKVALSEKIVDLDLFYFGAKPMDIDALFDNSISYIKIPSGRLNMIEFPKALAGIFSALWQLYKIYPDVLVSKGGYDSLPTIIAAWLLQIPVCIHESDSIPGKVNRFAGRFAKRVAVSFEEAGTYFPKEKVAWTGQPIRNEILMPAKEGFFEYFKLTSSTPTILVLGGSQGAEAINEVILESLPRLIGKYQIIHQVGPKHISEIKIRIQTILPKEGDREKYYPVGTLNPLDLKMAAGAAKLIISRAGSMIFEIAAWGVPSIIIPLPSAYADHQRKNAFNYARVGACVVVDETNISDDLLIQEIENIFADPIKYAEMKEAAKRFARPAAATMIAREVIKIATEHEK